MSMGGVVVRGVATGIISLLSGSPPLLSSLKRSSPSMRIDEDSDVNEDEDRSEMSDKRLRSNVTAHFHSNRKLTSVIKWLRVWTVSEAPLEFPPSEWVWLVLLVLEMKETLCRR